MPEGEYETLRAELLACVVRARATYRWTVTTIAAIFAAPLLAILTSTQDDPSVLADLLKASPEILIGVISAISTAWALIASLLTVSEEYAADRLGGYLAVFHDKPSELLSPGQLDRSGFHVWSRIEKMHRAEPGRIYFIQGSLWMLGLEVAMLGLLYALLALHLNQEMTYCILIWPLIAGVALWILLKVVTTRAKREFVNWTEQWAIVAAIAPKDLETLAQRAKLLR